jgi:hypothetical protein
MSRREDCALLPIALLSIATRSSVFLRCRTGRTALFDSCQCDRIARAREVGSRQGVMIFQQRLLINVYKGPSQVPQRAVSIFESADHRTIRSGSNLCASFL